MTSPSPGWSKRLPRDGWWLHRRDDRDQTPTFVRVHGREVFLPLEGESYQVDVFGGEWWSEEILPPPAALEYLEKQPETGR